MMRKMVATLGLVGGLAVGVLAPAAVAGADQTCYTGCEPPVTTTVPVAPTTEPTPVLRAASSGLAFTGGDIAGMTGLAVVTMSVGGLLVVRTRERRRSAQS